MAWFPSLCARHNGLWEEHRIEDVATPEAFTRDPILVQRFCNMRRAQLQLAHIQSKVMAWTTSVTYFGIHETAKKPGLHDEPLKGNRAGQRSVRLNKAYRLIYRVIEDRVLIEA